MKAIILAGGKGLRLRETVKNLPKPMAQIAGKPFLEYIILQLIKWDIKDIVLSVGYKGDIIKSYFGDGNRFGVKIDYCADNFLGTGGALKKAASTIENNSFILMNGDSFLNLDFKDMIAYHRGKKAEITIGLARVKDVSRFGSVEINNKGVVTAFIEKADKGEGFINGGIYIFNYRITNEIPPGKVSLERDVLPELIKKGIYGMISNGFFIDIGTSEDYINLCNEPSRLFESLGL